MTRALQEVKRLEDSEEKSIQRMLNDSKAGGKNKRFSADYQGKSASSGKINKSVMKNHNNQYDVTLTNFLNNSKYTHS